MNRFLKSNTIFSPFLGVLCVGFLTGCMQDMAQKDYNSTEEGYEQKVAENAVKQQRMGAPVPVVVNNPYALASSLGNIEPAAGNYTAANVPVINNNAAYSGLNPAMIQAGVFMQNSSPVYQQPNSFGSNVYSPTRY